MNEPNQAEAIADWLDNQPTGAPYDRLAASCAERFGQDAWTETRIRDYLLAHRKPGRPFRWSSDAEVHSFVGVNIGRVTLTELTRMCREKFGKDRAPGRSSLHLYSQYLAKRDEKST